MHVVMVFHGRIPATRYGGTERVIWGLGAALVRLGHRVTFLVGKGSTCPFAEIRRLDPDRPIGTQIPAAADLVHLHGRPPADDRIAKPWLMTMHGNMGDAAPLDRNTVFVSQNHARRHGADTWVHNGLEWADYTPPRQGNPRTYFHFLSKAAWRVKNVRGAIALADRCNVPLMVLGGRRLTFHMGFRFTWSPRARFCGMVGGRRKDALLNGSRGLVFPVIWNEPFGLAVIESLYYGCPVFGTPYGALPELVSSECGALATRSDALAEAMLQSDRYDRCACQRRAVERFSSDRMARDYLACYARVLDGQPLNPRPPRLADTSAPRLLPFT